jgi:hypothetical protein
VPLFLLDSGGISGKDNIVAPPAWCTATRRGVAAFLKTMSEQETDRTARAMREDVVRVAKGRPCHWVTVHDIAQRLGLDDDLSDAAVRHAIEQGWFVADSEPPHSVRLSVVPTAT